MSQRYTFVCRRRIWPRPNKLTGAWLDNPHIVKAVYLAVALAAVPFELRIRSGSLQATKPDRALRQPIKQFRRITARAYLSMLCIASSFIWIKTVNAA